MTYLTFMWVHFYFWHPIVKNFFKLGGVCMIIRFFRYILSKLRKKGNCNVSVTVTKFVVKKTVYKIEKDSTSAPSQPE